MRDDRMLFSEGPEGRQREALLALAAEGPVNRITLSSGAKVWLITGYAEAREALNDTRLHRTRAAMPYANRLPAETDALLSYMLNLNPPDHTRLRKLVSAEFSRRRVSALEPRIAGLCAELAQSLTAALDAGATVDLVAAFAFPLPFRVICELLGIPDSIRERLQGSLEPLAAGSETPFEEYAAAARSMLSLLREVLALKRGEPSDDLLSALVAARDGEDRLSDDELTAMTQLLLVAGHETTTGMIGNGLLALFRHPGQLRLLRDDPGRIPSAIEELLRFDDSVRCTLPSVAVQQMTIGNAVIEAGDIVTVSTNAACLDPRLNDDPTRLDITRAGNHLAFGHGIHYCLGAPLARLELRHAFTTLIGCLDDCELVETPELRRAPGMIFNHVRALPVTRAARPSANVRQHGVLD